MASLRALGFGLDSIGRLLDESEIGTATAELLRVLRATVPATAISAVDLVLVYDGRSEEFIGVAAGHPGEEPVSGLEPLDLAAVTEGVTVTFAEGPGTWAMPGSRSTAGWPSTGCGPAGYIARWSPRVVRCCCRRRWYR